MFLNTKRLTMLYVLLFISTINLIEGRLVHTSGAQTYSLTHNQASQRCAEIGGSLALPADLYAARSQGYSLCTCGWLADKSSRFSINRSLSTCGGRPGVHRCEWRDQWDAYCFVVQLAACWNSTSRDDCCGALQGHNNGTKDVFTKICFDESYHKNSVSPNCHVSNKLRNSSSPRGPVEGCSRALGIESGAIRDAQITSSSTYHTFWTERWGAERARLNSNGVVNAWMPHHDGRNQYVEVDLGRPVAITGIVTQGVRRYLKNQYVTSFRVAYSKDSELWIYYNEKSRTPKIFTGNRDNNGLVRNMFGEAVLAQHFRIYPYSWVRHISLRFELLGCEMTVYDESIEKKRENALDTIEVSG